MSSIILNKCEKNLQNQISIDIVKAFNNIRKTPDF